MNATLPSKAAEIYDRFQQTLSASKASPQQHGDQGSTPAFSATAR